MISLLGSALEMSAPSPLTKRREYECFIRGVATADRFGTRARYRMGVQHLAAISDFPEPTDAQRHEFGFMQRAGYTVELTARPGDEDGVYSRLYSLPADWRNGQVDVELVTRFYREDGTNVELVNARRGVVKSTRRRQHTLALEIEDLDLHALEALYPSKTYTAADWPELHPDHADRAVPQGVGTLTAVPLTYVVKTGGLWKFSACQVVSATPTVVAVYRSGRLVPSTEYTTATAVAGGITHLLIQFTREQLDFSGNLYDMRATLSCPGDRTPAAEAQRLLAALGQSTGATFTDAANYHSTIGIRGDYGYVRQKKATALLQHILELGRAQLYRTPAGVWEIFVDRPREVRAAFWDRADDVVVNEFVEPEIDKTIVLEYRPLAADSDETYGRLTRTTTGASGEQLHRNPFIYEHVVADRHLSYLTKREQNRAEARADAFKVQLAPGDVVAIRSDLSWNGGTKLLAAPVIARPPDANALTLHAYVEDVYTYTPGTLPTDPIPVPYVGPSAPASITATQTQSFEASITWPHSAPGSGSGAVREYILEQSTGGGAYAEIYRGYSNRKTVMGLSTGTSYTWRVKARDVTGPVGEGAESAYTTSSALVIAKKVNDDHVIGGGISGPSIANGSINRGRTTTNTGSDSGSLPAGATVEITTTTYVFSAQGHSNSAFISATVVTPSGAGDDTYKTALWNQNVSSMSYGITYRMLNT
jgi:hypothetical protein